MKLSQLNNEIKSIQKEIKYGLKNLSHIRDGKILCNKVGSHTVWRVKTNNGFRYLSKQERSTAEKLAERKYLTKRLEHLQRKEACLENLAGLNREETVIEEAFLGMESPYKELLQKKYLSKEDRLSRFACLENNQNASHAENLKIKTKSGKMVRSKIEAIVDELLYSMKLHYYYEPELELEGHKYYPDFFVIDEETAEATVIEIFGMMDDRSYAMNAVEKINLYGRNGYYIGDNYIPLFEHRNCQLSPDYIDKVLRKKFIGEID